MDIRNRSHGLGYVRLFVLAVVFCLLSFSNGSTSDRPAGANPGEAKEAQARYKKLALLVGINDYKYVKPLKGTVNDVKNMKKLLVERFGFVVQTPLSEFL